jgi:hypothetical protein
MPRWLWVLILLILIVVFVLPDPVAAGAAVGDVINAIIAFFRSFGATVT